VYGDGVMLHRMQAAIAARSLGDTVTLAGRIPRTELPEIYRRADVFIAPAFLESFGIAPLEARTAGVPVLAMRGSGVTEFIEDGREGLLAGDDAEMTDALVRIASDVELRQRIADHNRLTEPPQTWPKVLEHSDNAYRRALARQHQAG
jgi:glycosyltransferase involved in cell wall biosynthesis